MSSSISKAGGQQYQHGRMSNTAVPCLRFCVPRCGGRQQQHSPAPRQYARGPTERVTSTGGSPASEAREGTGKARREGRRALQNDRGVWRGQREDETGQCADAAPTEREATTCVMDAITGDYARSGGDYIRTLSIVDALRAAQRALTGEQ